MAIINADVECFIPAKEITPALWNMLRKKYLRSYKKIQRRIEEVGEDRLTIGFDEHMRPVWEQVAV